MSEGILVQLTHTGLISSSILLTDIDNAISDLNSFRKAGPVYVPMGGTVTLVYTTSVAKSYETGAIRQFKDAGHLTTEFLFGTEFASALIAFGAVPKLAALPGNNEGYDTGTLVVWTLDPISGPRTYQNMGTDAAVDWLPMGDSFSLGNFATNALAYAAAASRGYAPGGVVMTGVNYWNTTYDCSRTFDGTIWRGQAEAFTLLTADATILVNSVTGNDITGDGITVPYATPEAALQDVPRDGQNSFVYSYIVKLEGAGPYVLDCPTLNGMKIGYQFPNRQLLRFEGEDLIVDTTAAIGVAGVVTIDAAGVVTDTRALGRQFNIVGGGALVAHAHRGLRVRVASCAGAGGMVGAMGWIYDNDANGIFVVLDNDTFGSLAAGDTFEIMGFTTVMSFFAVSDWGYIVDAQFTISQMDIDLSTNIQFNNCDVKLKNTLIRRTANVRLPTANYVGASLEWRDAYVRNDHVSQMTELFGGNNGAWGIVERGCSVFDAYDGTGVQRVYNYVPTKVRINARLVLAGFRADSGICSDTEFSITVAPGTAGNFILAHNMTDVFAIAQSLGGKFEGDLPYIGGTVTGYLFDGSASNVGQIHGTLRLREAPGIVTVGATVARCRLAGVADQYQVDDFKILGTGNFKMPLMTLNHWVADDGVPSEAVNAGQPHWLLDAASDESIVASGKIPLEYIPGSVLVAEFFVDCGADVTGGHQALMDYTGILAKAGDTSTTPDTHATAAVPIVTTGAASEVQAAGTALTDGTGKINAVTPAEGDMLSVKIFRDGDGTGGTDDLTNDLRVYADTCVVSQIN